MGDFTAGGDRCGDGADHADGVCRCPSRGEVIGLQMGLSFATFFDPSGGPNMPILARILNLITLLLFLAFDGHLWLIHIVISSFDLIPVQVTPLNREGFRMLVQSANHIFLNGLMLALPFITLFLILNLALGILNRMTPQLSVFVVGFPLTLTVGISMLGLIISVLRALPSGSFIRRLSSSH